MTYNIKYFFKGSNMTSFHRFYKRINSIYALSCLLDGRQLCKKDDLGFVTEDVSEASEL